MNICDLHNAWRSSFLLLSNGIVHFNCPGI